LAEIRYRSGLTQAQLGKRIHRSQSDVSKIETGELIPDPMEVNAWAKACDVTPREFWDRWITSIERRV
jgi:transcriptional regulator with XRE-family HTH domain